MNEEFVKYLEENGWEKKEWYGNQWIIFYHRIISPPNCAEILELRIDNQCRVSIRMKFEKLSHSFIFLVFKLKKLSDLKKILSMIDYSQYISEEMLKKYTIKQLAENGIILD